ncbi:hypothetical protein FRACYDRAFT_232691 [Fragilariopsis cylindrus CCMP1102]|uniref:Uncharacterized protein n=1 Tax=Fragilariopsis cylindrus CCMP1102 TaxID=635003 RepID=A0A1E7FXJ2_9STRA|nr:hypothetical protein FRACYDRAFT_232691 [Fragilariopsis cylindrus CCMP1102]|eukprot:OEU22533.1 hypothetical protein FRACYDRAFT_232691 [Fragilariopsis cylindrus CCMP1102]
MTTNNNNNLSPIENLFLHSRLEKIKNGAGGVDDLILELHDTIPNSIIVDWKEYRGNILTASYDTATEVYRQQQKQKQITDGIDVDVDVDVDIDIDIDIDINLTLLDPFCGRGIFQPNYGRDYFGKYATTAVQILNTDDPVPTTNEPLPYCYCLDVTKSLKVDNFTPLQGDSMHSWPLAYYIRHYYNTFPSNCNKNENENNFSRGTVIKIS